MAAFFFILLRNMRTFNVTILGSGAAIPLISRNPSAQLLNIQESLFLVDCAEGTQVQLRKIKVRFQKIKHIFISHLHGDHYFGLIGLITSYHLLGRKDELHVYGHKPLKDIIDLHLESSNTVLRYPLIFHEIDHTNRSIIFEDKKLVIETFPLSHNFPVNGFLFREKTSKLNISKDFIEKYKPSVSQIKSIKDGGDFVDSEGNLHKHEEITTRTNLPRSYAYCTDTIYSEDVVPFVKGVNLLYHEATFANDKKSDAKEKFHSTAEQAAWIARKADAKKLLIGHFSARYRTQDVLLEEARAVFPETILARDGLRVDVE